MGLVKSRFLEEQERGWSAINDKTVCADCIDETFLKEFVTENASANFCDYCAAQSNEPISIAVEDLQELIYSVVYDYYAEPTCAGVPYDQGFIINPVDITDVFNNLGFDCHVELWNDITKSDHGNGYVIASYGHWASSTESESLIYSWSNFENIVKHRTRFNFSTHSENEHLDPGETPPRYMLDVIGDHLQGSVTNINQGTLVYRVRTRKLNHTWKPNTEELGAPPPEITTGGRMNPPGIPYLYTALDFNTAVYEARANRRTTNTVFVGQFKLTQTLKVIDLTLERPLPSIFDLDNRKERESMLFFENFVTRISQPITPDDKIHLSYIPTQVVCEFLAQCFTTKQGDSLDGIIFPSSLYSDGKNLVIFPSHNDSRPDFKGVMLDRVYKYHHPRKTSHLLSAGQIVGKITLINHS